MNGRRLLAGLTAVATTLACLATAAVAQDPEASVSVTERARPEFDPLGIRAGGFFIFPQVRVGTAYDSNVRASRTDREDDIIINVGPRIDVVSNFPRHALRFGTGADLGFFVDESDENYQDFFAFTGGRVDVMRDSAFDGLLRYDRLHQRRESPEDPGLAKPQRFHRGQAQLGYSHRFNRLTLGLTGDGRIYDYRPVFGLFGEERDRKEYRATGRVGFQVSPRIDLFTRGTYNWIRYDEVVVVDRDSDGFGIEGGVGIDITALLFGELFGGFRRQSYDNPAFDSVDGISFGGGLTWNPTGLTSVTFSARREIEETTEPGAPGNFSTDVGLRVDHELLRNLLINGSVGYIRDDFKGTARKDDIIRAGGGLTYLMNRYLSLDAGYSFTDRDSNVFDRNYSRHVVRLGVTGRL